MVLADESIGVRAVRSGGATIVFGKIIGKAVQRYGQRRERGGSRGFALFAVPFPSSRLRGSPEPRTRCSVPGSASGRVATLLLRVGGGTGDGRGLSGLWSSLLHHSKASSVPAPHPHPSVCRGAEWLSGAVRARLGSHPHRVVCAHREGPPTVTRLVSAVDVCGVMSLWHCKSCKVCCRGMVVVLPRVG